eukprot:COSAG02_NODE_1251_length_13599_cov_13.573259_2_plen_93_part_00
MMRMVVAMVMLAVVGVLGVEGAIPSVTVGDIRVQALSPTLLRVECACCASSASLFALLLSLQSLLSLLSLLSLPPSALALSLSISVPLREQH